MAEPPLRKLHFQGDWLFSDVIRHNARFAPKQPAVICDDQMLTWTEFDRRTRKVANALMARGIKRGDKVCLLLPNSVIAFELYWGVIRAGACVVALSQMLADESVIQMIDNSDSILLFTDQENAPQVERIEARTALSPAQIFVSGAHGRYGDADAFIESGSEEQVDLPIDPEDSINIVYSSGSTGAPKGIEISHLARHHYTFGMAAHFDVNAHSVALLATPFYTNGTWAMMSGAMFRGGCCVLLPKFSVPGFLKAVQERRCTHVFMVPTQLIQILAHPDLPKYDTSSLRVIESAGQALTPTTFDECARLLPHTELWEVYGMSEGFATVIGPRDYALGKRGSVGRPMALDDIRIIDGEGKELPPGQAGEICGYGVGLMKGYFKDPQKTHETIWIGPRGRSYLRSGDIGYLDDDGYLFLSGRLKDMIKSGGLNVFPKDIEEVMASHPAVKEASVIGVPHSKWVETPFAFVILKEGEAITADDLMAWTNDRVSKFQRISGLHLAEEFPRVTYNKVDKPGLRQVFNTLGVEY